MRPPHVIHRNEILDLAWVAHPLILSLVTHETPLGCVEALDCSGYLCESAEHGTTAKSDSFVHALTFGHLAIQVPTPIPKPLAGLLTKVAAILELYRIPSHLIEITAAILSVALRFSSSSIHRGPGCEAARL